jgi:GNAT superfamily N-acetyltransferase
MTDSFHLRPATSADVPALTRQRAEMYRDMGVLPDDQYEPLRAAFAAYLSRALPAGEYVAWVATTGDRRDVVAGAGLLLRPMLPALRRRDDAIDVALGPQGLVCNVFTERPWRRRGLARRLTETAIAGARERGVSHLFLHASAEGRPLYESLGFVPTSEMRYAGPL